MVLRYYFSKTIISICQVLTLNHDILVKRNHNRLTVGYLHRFFNKSAIVAAKERGNNDIFIPAGFVAGYARNNASIDGTYLLLNIPAIS